jgi:hypothetical protein
MPAAYEDLSLLLILEAVSQLPMGLHVVLLAIFKTQHIVVFFPLG